MYMLARTLDQIPVITPSGQLGKALAHLHAPRPQPLDLRQTLLWEGVLRGWWHHVGVQAAQQDGAELLNNWFTSPSLTGLHFTELCGWLICTA